MAVAAAGVGWWRGFILELVGEVQPRCQLRLRELWPLHLYRRQPGRSFIRGCCLQEPAEYAVVEKGCPVQDGLARLLCWDWKHKGLPGIDTSNSLLDCQQTTVHKNYTLVE